MPQATVSLMNMNYTITLYAEYSSVTMLNSRSLHWKYQRLQWREPKHTHANAIMCIMTFSWRNNAPCCAILERQFKLFLSHGLYFPYWLQMASFGFTSCACQILRNDFRTISHFITTVRLNSTLQPLTVWSSRLWRKTNTLLPWFSPFCLWSFHPRPCQRFTCCSCRGRASLWEEGANIYYPQLFASLRQTRPWKCPITYVTTHYGSATFALVCIQSNRKLRKKRSVRQNVLNCIQTSTDQCASTRLGMNKIVSTRTKGQVW